MIFRGKKIAYPAITQVSFTKVLDILEIQASDADPNVAAFAKNLLEDVKRYPQLRDGINIEDFDKDQDIIKRLCRVLFPDALLSNEIKGVIPPFEFKPFYWSTRFKKILEAAEEGFSFELRNYTEDQLYIFGCAAIMSIYYQYPFPMGMPRVVDIPNKKLGTVVTYRMAMNGDLMEVVPTENSIPISKEDYYELLDNFDNIELWKEKFPPDSWVVKGIGITNLMDTTVDHSIASIASALLKQSPDNIDKINNSLQSLFGIRDLKVGVLIQEKDFLVGHYIDTIPSILCNGEERLACKNGLCQYSYEVLINQKKPLIISDAERFDDRSKSGLSGSLRKQGIESYIMAPMINNGNLLGFLELGSDKKYELNSASIQRLNAVMPILSMALGRLLIEQQNRIEAIIQQECTTIHPSVKWRFEEEATKFIVNEQNNDRPVFSDIIFKDVYPLYGQLDIKKSTERRNQAVRADFTRQLSEVSGVLNKARQKTGMPIYEEMAIRVEAYRKELGGDFLSGSEQRILHFIEDEVHPTMNQIKKGDSSLRKVVEDYYALLDTELHSIYDQRMKYDQSVNVINQALASFLDEKQVEAQRMFPHYFERYKTDGVEYNIYIGQSISKAQDFDPVFLQNLQLWQLMVTCELERKFVEVRKEIISDIEIASLILAYSTPLSVHFRMDEKRFDVEGAYNARYEIVKKRVDKATIKGTDERITAPGKIAIIYAVENDAATYGRYITFLENKGYLKKNSKEVFELEGVQGIFGLKAMRVDINFDYGVEKETPFDVKEILESIAENPV